MVALLYLFPFLFCSIASQRVLASQQIVNISYDGAISSPAAFDGSFGWSIGVSSDFSMIGDPATCTTAFLFFFFFYIFQDYHTGAVYVYKLENDGWSRSATLIPTDTYESEFPNEFYFAPYLDDYYENKENYGYWSGFGNGISIGSQFAFVGAPGMINSLTV